MDVNDSATAAFFQDGVGAGEVDGFAKMLSEIHLQLENMFTAATDFDGMTGFAKFFSGNSLYVSTGRTGYSNCIILSDVCFNRCHISQS